MEDSIKKISDIYQDFKNNSSFDIQLLREKLDKNLLPSQEEKEKYSEVTTPYSLIEKMISVIPSDFWENPNVKVFDPCSGKGGFLLSLFTMFFKGLEKKIENIVERSKHILNNILYFSDISESNIIINREILLYHASMHCCWLPIKDIEYNSVIANSLGLCDDKWSEKFDLVIGNPPFNEENNKKIILWTKFVYKALQVWIKPGGYLVYVHPPLWRKPFFTNKKTYDKIFDLMTKQNFMHYLSINGKKEGINIFNCGTRFDWYLISKPNVEKGGAKTSPNSLDSFISPSPLNSDLAPLSPSPLNSDLAPLSPSPLNSDLTPPFSKVEKVEKVKTNVDDEDGIIHYLDLTKYNWLPSKNYDLVSSVLAINNEEKCPIMYSRSFYGTDKSWMSPQKNEKLGFIYPCIHSTLKGGITRYYYSKFCNKGHFSISKVIFGESGIFEPILDINGEYGMTHCAMAIEISNMEEGEKIVKALKSEKFHKLIESCYFSSFRIDWRMFIDFKKDFYLLFL